MLKKDKIAAYEALVAEYKELKELIEANRKKWSWEEYREHSDRCGEIVNEAKKLIPMKMKQAHWDDEKKLFYEQVKNEPDKQKADVNFAKLAHDELAWLRDHPGYPRFFSPLNDEVNPIVLTFPDEKKVPCKDCVFADKSLGGATKAFCEVYKYPNMKPDNVLWGSKPRCEYYVKKGKENG